MKNLSLLLLVMLLVALSFSVYRDITSSRPTFALESTSVEVGGMLTGLVSLGQPVNLRPAEQRIATEVRVLRVGEDVSAELLLESKREEYVDVEYYVLDTQAEKVSSGLIRIRVDGKREMELGLESPEKPGEYIFHVTVRDNGGISTDLDVFRVP